METPPKPTTALTTPTASAHAERVYNLFAGDISLSQFYMGYEFHLNYKDELTDKRRINAAVTLVKINQLLAAMRKDGVHIEWWPRSPKNITASPLTSGWRPRAINITTPGAAPFSWHIECCAGDLYDPEGALDGWCLSHQSELERIGLYMEHPAATKGWCHVQTVAPRSGRRVFYP
jgi:hypothetical protein